MSMDPHSRLSQFNQRAPKSGPPPASRFVADVMQKPSLDTFPSSSPLPTASGIKKKTPSKSSHSSGLLVRRPIATNSRIKKDEAYRRDMYLAFVINALEQKLNGNSEPFDELVSQFNPRRQPNSSPMDTSTSLRTWILALTHVVSRLDRAHSSLVEAIATMPWTTLDAATVKSYIVFIGILLSARPEYLSLVLGEIAQGFTYQSGIQALSRAFPESSVDPITRRVIYDRLHYLLQHLLSLIPTLPSTLQSLLVRHFPHKRQNQLMHSTYIRNMLRVSSYCPELSEKILATIVDRAIQIDVEIQVEIEELEDEESPEEQPLFEFDPFDMVLGQEEHESSDLSEVDDSDDDAEDGTFSDLSSDADGYSDDVPPPEVLTNAKHIQDMVKKLDMVLTLMFEHFKRTHVTVGEPGSKSDSALRHKSTSDLPALPPLFSQSPSMSSLPPSSPVPGVGSGKSSNSRATSADPLTPNSQQTLMNIMQTQFNTLLSIFDRTILRTFKSRYTQFLVFWFTSLDPEFADIFQGMLVERALFGAFPSAPGHLSPPNELIDEGDLSAGVSGLGGSTITRAAAASYIGSFVSRALFVDTESTRRIVTVLCEFLEAQLDEVEESIRTFSSSVVVGGPQHMVFYAVTQTVFLIFCFRWRELMDLGEGDNEVGGSSSVPTNMGGTLESEVMYGEGRKWMPKLTILQRVVNSVLNPLKVCSPNVVMQFARVAQATNFIYCYTILESNKRLENNSNPINSNASRLPLRLPTSSSAILVLDKNDPLSVTAELNTFFPFDPYRLPKSAAFIKDVYREWSSVSIGSESDDDDSDNDEVEMGSGNANGSDTPNSLREDMYLAVPQADPRGLNSRRKGNHSGESESDIAGGLGESLGQMSISPR